MNRSNFERKFSCLLPSKPFVGLYLAYLHTSYRHLLTPQLKLISLLTAKEFTFLVQILYSLSSHYKELSKEYIRRFGPMKHRSFEVIP
jgi:hypothetical protein